VWRGRVTGVIGQDVSPQFSDIFVMDHPLTSGKTMGKELIKHILGALGSKKYAMQRANRVLRVEHLRDGRPIYEFLRCNPCRRGVELCATADGMAEVLTEDMLDRLVNRKGVCILYTHFGKVTYPNRPFNDATRRALEGVAQRYHDNRLLVTTTVRLLDYLRARELLRWSAHCEDREVLVTINGLSDPIRGYRSPLNGELRGITFRTKGDQRVRVIDAQGRTLESKTFKADGQTFVSLAWDGLDFPDL
jgi:hypothetical protein